MRRRVSNAGARRMLFTQFLAVFAVFAVFASFNSLRSLCSLRNLRYFQQFAQFSQFSQILAVCAVCAGCANLCIWAYFNPGSMQVWFMQYYVRKVRKKAAIRVFSKAAPIRLVQMQVLPAGTLSGALLPRDLRAATRLLA